MKRYVTLLAVLLAAVLMANPAYCSTVSNGATISAGGPGRNDATPPVPGLWYEFLFFGVGSEAQGCFGACGPSSGGNSTDAMNPPWTFTTSTPVTLYVTDAFEAGDAFDVYNNSALVLSTPMVSTGYSCGSDPVDCYGNPNMSWGSVILPAGSDSITIFVTESCCGSGATYFSPEATTPEPSTLVLLLRRRRWL
jgi:hypothetical protein